MLQSFTASQLLHQALPLVEAAAKAKLAGTIETQPGYHFAALSAFCIVDVPIMKPYSSWTRMPRGCRNTSMQVLILASYLEPDGTTTAVASGQGNYYAVRQQQRAFLNLNHTR